MSGIKQIHNIRQRNVAYDLRWSITSVVPDVETGSISWHMRASASGSSFILTIPEDHKTILMKFMFRSGGNSIGCKFAYSVRSKMVRVLTHHEFDLITSKDVVADFLSFFREFTMEYDEEQFLIPVGAEISSRFAIIDHDIDRMVHISHLPEICGYRGESKPLCVSNILDERGSKLFYESGYGAEREDDAILDAVPLPPVFPIGILNAQNISISHSYVFMSLYEILKYPDHGQLCNDISRVHPLGLMIDGVAVTLEHGYEGMAMAVIADVVKTNHTGINVIHSGLEGSASLDIIRNMILNDIFHILSCNLDAGLKEAPDYQMKTIDSYIDDMDMVASSAHKGFSDSFTVQEDQAVPEDDTLPEWVQKLNGPLSMWMVMEKQKADMVVIDGMSAFNSKGDFAMRKLFDTMHMKYVHHYNDKPRPAIMFMIGDKTFILTMLRDFSGISVISNNDEDAHVLSHDVLGKRFTDVEFRSVPMDNALKKIAPGDMHAPTHQTWNFMKGLAKKFRKPDDAGVVFRDEKEVEIPDVPSHQDMPDMKMRKIISGPLKPSTKDDGTSEWKFLEKGLPAIIIPKSGDPQAFFDALMSEFPYFRSQSIYVTQRYAMSQKTGKPFHFPPILLNGAPGIGKTRWSRKIADMTGTGSFLLGMSGTSSSMGISGSDRGYKDARPGMWAFAMQGTKTANPVMILDEIDKTASGANGSAIDALLPYLEKQTSSKYHDRFLTIDADVSLMSYIMTSNALSSLPEAFLSRIRLFECRVPTAEEINAIFSHILLDVAKEIDLYANDIQGMDFSEIRHGYREHHSIRILRQNIEKKIMKTFFSHDVIDDNALNSRPKIGFNL